SIERLNFSASVFHMDIIDIHVYRVEGGGQLYLAANADKAYSTGAEFEFTYFATDALEVSASLGIINAKYDSYDAGEANYDGEPIHHTPSRTAKYSIGYNDPNGFYVRGDVRHVGETYYFNGTNQTFDKADPYSVLDMKAGYRNSSLDIYLYGKNVTDTEYINGLRAGSVAVATFGDPAAFGAGASYKF
ncbi:MAG: TonB-dependent receptor, partial [Proteobacteria bacterium]|nr:TonB-dependent receptor [Pseudomonadota bacterium]